MPRHILVAAVSGLLVAAACVDDISSTSGDTLSAAELASRSSAQYGLFLAGVGMTRGGGYYYYPVPLPVASQLQLPPYTFDRSTQCPAGGNTTMKLIINYVQDGQRTLATATQKATDCAVTLDDGTTWTFESSGLEWAAAWNRIGEDYAFSYDATVRGSLSWSGEGKRGGCLVDLAIRESGVFAVHDTTFIRGQACGARVDIRVGWL